MFKSWFLTLDINRRYAHAAARVIQARWRLYKAKSRRLCSLKCQKFVPNCGLCTKIDQYNTLNILTVKFNNAWLNWRSHCENKRIVDGLFYTEFLTDRPEVVRHDILTLSENISDFFGKKNRANFSRLFQVFEVMNYWGERPVPTKREKKMMIL